MTNSAIELLDFLFGQWRCCAFDVAEWSHVAHEPPADYHLEQPRAEVGLIPRTRAGYAAHLKIYGDPYEEIRIGTQPDGTFIITNVPAPVDWYVYSKMESISALGATDAVEVSTARDGADVNVGDIEIHPGHHFRGKVALADGATIADGMRMSISSTRAWDTQTVLLNRDGSFEFTGLASGKYEIFPSVRGYRLQGNKRVLETMVDGDVESFRIVLDASRR